jgi:glycolate dehydrogenase FAD-binding subunit
MHGADLTTELQQQMLQAARAGAALELRGGGSKTFLGRHATGMPLEIGNHCGIIDYEPRELVITARAGTRMSEINSALAEAGQMLAFEPPLFGANATLGGVLSCGLSGPRRPYAGSARDFTLGCRMINGHGEVLRFGGQVMKNVAGYDVPRLMVGAYGTLGILLEASLKVLPRPAARITLAYECDAVAAIRKMSSLLSQPYPVDGACFHGELCRVRLSGSAEAVRHARAQLGGEAVADGDAFWQALNEQQLSFFTTAPALYRVMVKPDTPPLPVEGKWLLDWGGAQRWLVTDQPLDVVRRQAAAAGGHATVFRGGDRDGEVFAPPAGELLALMRRLKHSFDPQGIFNPGRLYADF